jgi:general secretion pathway protein M
MIKLLAEPKMRGRMLFVLGNLAAVAVFVGVIIVPIYEMFAERASRIERQGQRLARLEAIANEAGHVEAMASQAKGQMQAGEFLAGPNENVISAELQTKLKAMTEAAGARSRAIQALPVKTADQVKSAGVRIEIFGPLQSIARAVYAIETAKPYLFISAARMKMNSPNRPGVADEPVIQAQLDVFGAMQIRGQP